MRTGRADLDAVLRLQTIPSDEPTFVLRAQDQVAADAVRSWAALYLAEGGSEAVAESALQQAQAMEDWKVKKLPDDDHWTIDERRHLIYLFNQRAYRARGDDADLRIRLAEQRSYSLARSQMRAFLKGPAAREIINMSGEDCAAIADLFRETGEEIAHKPAAQQVFVWSWLLTLALDHGGSWKEAMAREVERRRITIRHAQAEKALACAGAAA